VTPWRFTLLGYQLGLARPDALLGLAAVALVGAVAIRAAAARRRRADRLVPRRLQPALAPIGSLAPAVARAASATAALACFVVALAQPQCGERAEVVKRRGIDVVVALDASKSMLARDVPPSRLERARLELGDLLDALKGDRVAIVAFAGDAFIQCPLTSDYAAAKVFLRAVDPMTMPQGGTDLGAALLTAKRAFEQAERGSKEKVVVLLSDGEDLEGDLDQGLDALKAVGARVYAVGIGGAAGEPIPIAGPNGEVAGYQKDESGRTVLSRLDRAGLARIAEATGGAYFEQPKGVAVARVVDAIDRLEKTELASRVAVRYGEAFQPFAAAGIALLAVSLALVPSWYRRRATP
jgi:Ca-activated chloride channel family protein